MEIAVSAFRARLRDWLERARAGEEVVVTERGVPVARVIGVEGSSLIERLTLAGVISAPASSTKPTARGRSRVRPAGSVADLVSEQRD